MSDQKEQIIREYSANLDPIRFANQENGIKEWLVQNNAKQFLTRTEELLSSLPKEEYSTNLFPELTLLFNFVSSKTKSRL